ncbi:MULTISPECIES: GPW/gp25 family protein [unclassified Saccharicrinis]|uniref:GPW/gp25 family protein n=1 Tax=unclassified Saccharicrinis TaxID=2646859 RepID=UPI003D3471B0
MPEYLDIPLALGAIKQQQEIPRIDIKKSIHNMIHLIITSAYEEVKHDHNFGTEIWDYDFENTLNYYFLKDDLRISICDSITDNEKRLANVNVKLQIDQVESGGKVQNIRIKTRLIIEISGIIQKTNEILEHRETFYIGPLSY